MFNDLILFIRKLPGFIYDLFGNTDLPYIMKQSDLIYFITLTGAFSITLSNLFRVFRNPFGMSVCKLILCIDSIYQR